MGENQNAYKIVGNRLVNVNNPDEWYYLDVLKKTSSRDSKRKDGTMSYSQLQKIRKNYHLSPDDEARLYELGPQEILQKSYNNFEFPPNSGYPGDSNHTYVSQDVEAYHSDGTLISKEDILNAENGIPQDDIVWRVQFEDYNYYDFKPAKSTDGKTYYYCEISGKKMIYDPKTGKVYYY